MAGETTTTTMTGGINTSLIAKVGLNYAIDPIVMLPHLRMEPVAGSGTKTAAFWIPTKSTGVASVSEGTAMSNSALTLANTTVAVAEYGILRRVMKLAARTNILGEAGTYQFIIEDGVRLCLEKFETDAWAQLDNASTSVGTSGANFTIANFAAGISQLTINKSRGPYVALLSVYASRDLRAAVASSSASVWVQNNNGLQNVTSNDGYCGTFMGVPAWTSTLAKTSSSDKVSGFMADGAANPMQASTGAAIGWMPEPEIAGNPTFPGSDVAVTVAYGLGEIADFNYVKAVTIGS